MIHRLVISLLLGLVAVVLVGGLVVLGIALGSPPSRQQDGMVALGLTAERAPARAAVTQTSGSAVDPAWVRRTAAASGIPATAVDAYGRAVLATAKADPGCHLGWTTLAGVGTVESANGTLGGRRLLANGYADRPITGPALDGAGGFATIRDENGWVRAVGPMQFLPSSWQTWGADGDGDGRADIHDIFDAALAAAHYLCADGRDLATARGWTEAIYSYNHSATYVRQVYEAATAAGPARHRMR